MKFPRIPKRYQPTTKWWVLFISSDATIAAMLWTGDGINTDDEKKALIGIIAALALTYATRNEPNEPKEPPA